MEQVAGANVLPPGDVLTRTSTLPEDTGERTLDAADASAVETSVGSMLTPADLARESGVRVQTIQRWQKRYGFPVGSRSRGGHRRYTHEDVDLVRRVCDLRDSGLLLTEAIQLVMGRGQLASAGGPPLDGSILPDPELGRLRNEALQALARLDEPPLWAALEEATDRFGEEDVITHLVIPLIRTTDDPSNQRQPERIHAYFFARIAMTLLSRMAAAQPRGDGPRVWVACPGGEAHEVGALCAVVLLAKSGVDVRYLGANVPLETLHPAASRHRPDAVVLAVRRSVVIREQMAALRELAEVTRVFVAGRGAWRAHVDGSPVTCLEDDLGPSVTKLLRALQLSD